MGAAIPAVNLPNISANAIEETPMPNSLRIGITYIVKFLLKEPILTVMPSKLTKTIHQP